jgi:hypothetical protein
MALDATLPKKFGPLVYRGEQNVLLLAYQVSVVF